MYVWPIYLQNWVVLGVNVGKFTPYIEHLGYLEPNYITSFLGGLIVSILWGKSSKNMGPHLGSYIHNPGAWQLPETRSLSRFISSSLQVIFPKSSGANQHVSLSTIELSLKIQISQLTWDVWGMFGVWFLGRNKTPLKARCFWMSMR